MERYKTVDEFIENSGSWEESLRLLRSIIHETELDECMKWMFPVYTLNKKNVLGLGAFKNYVGIWFFQGVFLEDSNGFLINAQEGKTQAMRQWRFSGIKEINQNIDMIKAYVYEAIDNQAAGKEMKPIKKPLIIPEPLQIKLNADSTLRNAFESLNLTKKREFCEYITSAKRAETVTSRMEKIVPLILSGVSMNDKYRTKK